MHGSGNVGVSNKSRTSCFIVALSDVLRMAGLKPGLGKAEVGLLAEPHVFLAGRCLGRFN